MLTWQTFKARRRIQVAAWLRNQGVETYEQLVGVLRTHGVDPPTPEEAEADLILVQLQAGTEASPEPLTSVVKATPKKKAPTKRKARARKPPVKKAATSRKKKVDVEIPEVEIPKVEIPEVEV